MVKQVVDSEWKTKQKNGWMLPLQAANRWKVSVLTVFGWIKNGKLDAVQHVTLRVFLIDPAKGKP